MYLVAFVVNGFSSRLFTISNNFKDDHRFNLRFCSPCGARITHVLKFETLDRDSNFILKMAKNIDISQVKMQRKNQSPRRKKSNHRKGDQSEVKTSEGVPSDTKEIARNWLKSLGEDLYAKISLMFEIDSDLFGYQVIPFDEL